MGQRNSNVNELAGCPAARGAAECGRPLLARCEDCTAVTRIRVCDWRWAFVFSGYLLRRVVSPKTGQSGRGQAGILFQREF